MSGGGAQQILQQLGQQGGGQMLPSVQQQPQMGQQGYGQQGQQGNGSVPSWLMQALYGGQQSNPFAAAAATMQGTPALSQQAANYYGAGPQSFQQAAVAAAPTYAPVNSAAQTAAPSAASSAAAATYTPSAAVTQALGMTGPAPAPSAAPATDPTPAPAASPVTDNTYISNPSGSTG